MCDGRVPSNFAKVSRGKLGARSEGCTVKQGKFVGMSHRELKAFLHDRVKEIAVACASVPALEGFTYDLALNVDEGELSTWAKLSHSDGRALSFYLQTNDGRIEINGSIRWQDEKHNYIERPRDLEKDTITVASDREAAKIAREIERRVMPAYTKNWARFLEYRDGRTKQYAGLERAVEVLTAAGIRVHRNRDTRQGAHFWFVGHSGTGELTGESVRIKFEKSFTPEQAVRVIKMLNEITGED
jgi:hypothetical protein